MHFHVNWFRKNSDGKFIWPGFRENMRILKWIVDRARGRAAARETSIGWMPRYEDIEWAGMDFSADRFDELQHLDRAAWRRGYWPRGVVLRSSRPSPARNRL
jgi:phosphoenolpyruvate carboxykinase (GTP)